MNYYWRLFATFLSFTIFGLGGVILSLTVFPVIYLLPIKKQKKILLSRRIVRKSFRIFIGFMKHMGVISYETYNIEKLARPDLLIIANHPSLIDVVFLISMAELPNCVIKTGVWNNPCMFFVVRSAGFIENGTHPEDFLERCTHALNGGDGLIIFPEGTRTDPGEDIVMQRGCAHIALTARKNLTPVSITCNPVTLTKKHRWYNIPKTKRPHFCISVGDDIEIKNFLAIKDGHNNAARQLSEHMKKRFIEGMR